METFFNFALVAFFTILTLYIINNFVKNKNTIQVVNFLLLCEGFVLTFLFKKYPSSLSFIIVLFSSYYLIYQGKHGNSLFKSKYSDSLFPKKAIDFFPLFGFFGILSIMIYELNADRTFSTSGLLVFILSILLIFYYRIPDEYSSERDFFTFFVFLINIMFVFPEVIYKLIYGYIGDQNIDYWYNGSHLTYLLLAKPLSLFLSIFGYNTVVDGAFLSYEDLTTHTMKTVQISENCAGLNSIKIFVSALASYALVETRKLSFDFFLLLTFGLFISYLANLFRMAIIILAGHYYGSDFLIFTHQYAGWLIFTVWLLVFWFFAEKFLSNKDRLE